MISDLIEFGKWLDENNQDDFGKLIKEDDRIAKINVEANKDGEVVINDFGKKIENLITDYDNDNIDRYSHYKEKNSLSFSLFSNQLFFETNQNIMIPSNSLFACLSPFVVSLKRINKKKISGSLKSNENGGEFIHFVSLLKDSGVQKRLAKKYDALKVSNDKKLFEETLNNLDKINKVILSYYRFLDNNFNEIERLKNKISKKDPDVYLYFQLPEKYILFNDIIYLYCKYLKSRAEKVDESKINENNENRCQFCGKEENSFVKFSPINISNKNYNWNFTEGLSNARLKICKECSARLYLAVQKLIHVFENNFILIPKLKSGKPDDFKKVVIEINSYYNSITEDSKRKSKFRLLSNFISDSEYYKYFNFDFLVFEKTRMGEDIDTIKKYVENYKAYLVKFKDAYLYKDGGLYYLFDEPFKKSEKEKNQIENMFDIEFIFKQFFIGVNNNKIFYPSLYHFYQIYTKDLVRKGGIFYNFDTKTVSIFAKYMHNIFNLIYELNEDALNKNMLNEIVLNCLIKLQKYNKTDEKNRSGIFYFDIIKRLNYYYMVKRELLGDKMLEKKDVEILKKEIFAKYNEDNKDIVKSISGEDNTRIKELIENDPSIKYYLLGKFIKLIEGFKSGGGKKVEVFNNYVTNANRNNIRNLFVTEVLKKNNYYIEKMGKKGKFVFNLIEENLGELFNEKGLSFEDHILLLFTGYYTENILASSYGAEKKSRGDKE